MVTRHTRNKKKYNKSHIKNKIDNLAINVAKKGIFVVGKSDPGYKVLDCISKKLIIDNIPFMSVAKNLADKLNKAEDPTETSLINLNNHINRYYKYMNDILFYKNTINNSIDQHKVSSARARLLDAVHMAKEARTHINFI